MKVQITEQNPIQAGDVLENGGVVREYEVGLDRWEVLLPSGSILVLCTEHFIGFTITRDEVVSGKPVAILTIDECGDDAYISPMDGGKADTATAWKLRRMGFKDGDEFYLIKKEQQQ